MPLDIRGAFDSIWWNGLLQHLWSVGLWGSVYKLMCSYLSNRTLFVVTHGDTSSKRAFTAGVPQGGIWSSILLNLYTRHLSAQIFNCDLFMYADDTTLVKVIPTKDNRNTAAIKINADLNRICLWGRKWIIIFEPDKCYSLCCLLKKDVALHRPLYMDALLIAEVDVLKSWGFTLIASLLGSIRLINWLLVLAKGWVLLIELEIILARGILLLLLSLL